MNTDNSVETEAAPSRAWGVAALVRALADALSARFNPITVRGEITGFSRATSGHCYFTLKDTEPGADSAISCAMFRRTAGLIDFAPKNGDVVELRGRVAVYEARGSLQLVAEHLQKVQTSQGQLWARFEQLKAQLAAEGLFDAALKRPIPRFVRCVAVVTSRQAAALQDVLTALARRAPHVQVLVFTFAVESAAAPGEILESLSKIERYNEQILGQRGEMASRKAEYATNPVRPEAHPSVPVRPEAHPSVPVRPEAHPSVPVRPEAHPSVPVRPDAHPSVHPELVEGLEGASTSSARTGGGRAREGVSAIDAVLLVRGGGSLEDLWAFNDAQVVRAARACSVPLICGVGHETDFSLCDFAADVRAPTPTAAAELVSQPTEAWAGALDGAQDRLQALLYRRIDAHAQRLDQLGNTLGRPQQALHAHTRKLDRAQQRLRHAALLNLERKMQQIHGQSSVFTQKLAKRITQTHSRLDRAEARLHALDPQRVLERGYALLHGESGQVLSSAAQLLPDAKVSARLHDGEVDLRVLPPKL